MHLVLVRVLLTRIVLIFFSVNYIMSNAINHYGLCCAGSHCVQTNQVVICSICGNAMHESCGVSSGDNSLICFLCHSDNVAVGLEEVFNVNLAAEFSIESSDGVNFQPALFPSMVKVLPLNLHLNWKIILPLLSRSLMEGKERKKVNASMLRKTLEVLSLLQKLSNLFMM